jgi:hypothetical protein
MHHPWHTLAQLRAALDQSTRGLRRAALPLFLVCVAAGCSSGGPHLSGGPHPEPPDVADGGVFAPGQGAGGSQSQTGTGGQGSGGVGGPFGTGNAGDGTTGGGKGADAGSRPCNDDDDAGVGTSVLCDEDGGATH